MSPLAARFLAVALAVATAVVVAVHAGPLPCTSFLHPFISCSLYITGHEDVVPDKCCMGVQSMAGMMTTRADRVAACECFKALGSQMHDIDYGRVASLPLRCQAAVQFDFAPDIKCDKIEAAVGTEAEEHL